jgi:hypothetical protein
MVQAGESVARKYGVLRPHLDERQRRLLLGAEAAELGRGGIKAVAQATGVHPDTVARGVREVEGQPEPQPGVRAPGGGRKKLAETDPQLAAELKRLVDPETPSTLASIRPAAGTPRAMSTHSPSPTTTSTPNGTTPSSPPTRHNDQKLFRRAS